MPIDPRLPETPERVWPYRWLAFLLILGSLVFRLGYLIYDCPLDLAPDEAHYWHWSQRLDWSYYSKGPLVALLIRASCWLFGGWSEQLMGNQMAAVRVPAVLCGALLLTSLYVLATLFLRKEKWAVLVVALALTMPIIAVGSLLMTIDAPYTCCWGWALVFVYRALFRASPRSWLWAGVCVAIGVLAKYTMVLFVPMLALCLAATPPLRPHLRRPGFWMLVLVGALGGVPILLWNMNNDWLTLRHTLGAHVGMQGDNAARVHWLGPLAYLGTQCALFLVYWFVVWAWAMVVHNPGRESRPEYRFLWFMSVPMFIFFMLFSLKNGGGEANWPITAYLSGMVLAGAWLLQQFHSPSAFLRRSAWILAPTMAVLGMLLTVLIHEPRLMLPMLARVAGPPTPENPMPIRQFDATCRVRGYRATLAAELDRQRARLRAEGIEPVLAGAGWNLPGEISFYCQGHPDAYCLGGGIGERHSQYDLWLPNPVEEPEPFMGRTFIMVGARADVVRAAFDGVEPTYEVYFREAGQTIAGWTITVCRGYRGFPPEVVKDRKNY
ncbi:MAG TPA: glycosyltransferase family 39 protein [Gemmataceae bacterium]|nr:glycosyltransferase family 39 protein [Gemmataceae bacterium]